MRMNHCNRNSFGMNIKFYYTRAWIFNGSCCSVIYSAFSWKPMNLPQKPSFPESSFSFNQFFRAFFLKLSIQTSLSTISSSNISDSWSRGDYGHDLQKKSCLHYRKQRFQATSFQFASPFLCHSRNAAPEKYVPFFPRIGIIQFSWNSLLLIRIVH